MMKSQFLDKMREAGDAIITYRSPVSKKLKYNVCTLDFNSCEYIKEKNQKKSITVKKECILLFCWDTDSFRQINISAVTNIQPLGTVLRNRSLW
jgi:hypothetical protein